MESKELNKILMLAGFFAIIGLGVYLVQQKQNIQLLQMKLKKAEETQKQQQQTQINQI